MFMLIILETPRLCIKMADDWNTVTIIGSRRNQAAGGGNKERQLNIARRQGAAIVTETKVK